MNIKESNEIIAKFMNYKYPLNVPSDIGYGLMRYYESWDWLMPVVEKIEDLDPNERLSHMYSVEITGNGTTIQPNMWGGNDRWMIRHNSRNNRLHNTYRAIIDFIKWRNENR